MSEHKGLRKTKIVMGIAGALVCLVIIVAVMALSGGKMYATDGENLVVQSTLEMSEVGIIAQTSGQLVELHVLEGESIKEGDIIGKIDNEALLAQREKAQAAVDVINAQITAANAQYQTVKNGSRSEEVAQLQAGYDLTKANYDRIKVLYDNGAISKMEFDNIATQLEVASQKLKMAQNGATEENLTAAGASVDVLEGQLKQAEAGIKELDSHLKKTVITAPVSGIITQLNVDKGELVAGGMSIATITDTSSPWIQCNVMEDELSGIEQGQNVEILLSAYPEDTFQGEIVSVNKSADFAVKRATNDNGEFDILSYGVKVKPLEVTEQLFAGMTVFVDFGEK